MVRSKGEVVKTLSLVLLFPALAWSAEKPGVVRMTPEAAKSPLIVCSQTEPRQLTCWDYKEFAKQMEEDQRKTLDEQTPKGEIVL
jgi:hypothetical protein